MFICGGRKSITTLTKAVNDIIGHSKVTIKLQIHKNKGHKLMVIKQRRQFLYHNLSATRLMLTNEQNGVYKHLQMVFITLNALIQHTDCIRAPEFVYGQLTWNESNYNKYRNN